MRLTKTFILLGPSHSTFSSHTSHKGTWHEKKEKLTIAEHGCARHCATPFKDIDPHNSHHIPGAGKHLFSPCYSWESWDSQKLSDLPKVIQPWRAFLLMDNENYIRDSICPFVKDATKLTFQWWWHNPCSSSLFNFYLFMCSCKPSQILCEAK